MNLESFQRNIVSERQKQQRSNLGNDFVLGQYLKLYQKSPGLKLIKHIGASEGLEGLFNFQAEGL